jgi:hypothetical protein
MNNPETQVTLSSQDIGRGHTKQKNKLVLFLVKISTVMLTIIGLFLDYFYNNIYTYLLLLGSLSRIYPLIMGKDSTFSIRTVPKFNIKMVERCKMDTPKTQIHDRPLFWLGTCTSISTREKRRGNQE